MRHLILTALLLTACPSAEDTSGDCPDADRDDVCDSADLCTGDDATGDTDSDGICDAIDICTGDDSLGDADLDGICDGDNDTCFGEDSTNDTDGDGICDDRDLCTGDDALGDADNDDVCDSPDDICFGNDLSGDSDLDGVCDDSDQCAGNDAVGDTDLDGSCDDTDICRGDDATGDSDTDGVCDDSDACPNENDLTADPDGDGVCGNIDQCDGNDASGDSDSDGVCDDIDQCTGNDAQPDTDNDGICEDIDLCTGDDSTGDTDRDGTCNDSDLCTGDDTTGDSDNDGVCDSSDACIGDDTSGDSDDDGTCDDSDACIGDDSTGNSDGDAYCNDIDQCDGDDALGDLDNDGLCNDTDPCVGSNNEDEDRDGICDGRNDQCEGDDNAGDTDGDGVCDDIDLCYGMDRLGDSNGDNLCGSGTIYHVISGIPSRFHDGLTWENAFRTPALAAEVAGPGDTVFLRSIPSVQSAYPPERVLVEPDVQWIGGFQGTETHPDERPTDRITGLALPTPHGDIRDSDLEAHWVVQDGYVDALEFRGYRDAAIEVSGDSFLNNIVIAQENSQGSAGHSQGLVFQDTDNARLTAFRCRDRDVRYNRCLTINTGSATVAGVRLENVTTSSSGAAIIAGGSLSITDMTTSGVSTRLFNVVTNGDLLVTHSDLSNITTPNAPVILAANDATASFVDTTMSNNQVVNGTDVEGGLMDVYRTDLTLSRVHIVDTGLVNANYILGGVIKVMNRATQKMFDMRDSSIHGTSFNFPGSVSGGVLYLDSTNAFLIGNTFGPLDSPFPDERVSGALMVLEDTQATLTNNAMWTPHTHPIATIGQLNLAWGNLCAPGSVDTASQGPTSYIELVATPFAAPSGHQLLLATNSPCIDEGRTATSDSFNIWWPGRISQQGTTRDIAPVDLGAHYTP